MSDGEAPMSDQPRRRSRRGLLVLLSVIVVILLAETVLVVAVFVSPSTGERLESVAASAERAWEGSERKPGVRARTAQAVEHWFDDWIAPLWRRPDVPQGEPEFTACVDCHEDYATTRRFGVYMDHPLHAEIGVACETCHPTNPHPSPPRPREAVCEDCHAEVRQQDRCSYCHPPGSLPHFYQLGAPRDASTRCDVCHPKDAFDAAATEPLIDVGAFSGEDGRTCRSCHEDTTCESCHDNGHPLGWATTHADAALGGDCYACHTATWCADRCHAVTSVNPLQPKPLPSVGVRP